MELPELATSLLGPLGVVALVLLALVAYLRGWWYSGSTVDKMIADHAAAKVSVEAERDRAINEMKWWRNIALKTVGIAEEYKESQEPVE